MEVPKQAKCVFKGNIFDVYQWEQKMFDGSTAIFERIKRPNTVEVIALVDGKIMICKEEQPQRSLSYGLFGGRQDEHEEPIATAKRELLEESGLTSQHWKLYKAYEPQEKIDWKVYVYIAKDCKKIAEQKLDNGERITPITVDFDEFVKIVSQKEFSSEELAMDVLRMRVDGKLNEFKGELFKSER